MISTLIRELRAIHAQRSVGLDSNVKIAHPAARDCRHQAVLTMIAAVDGSATSSLERDRTHKMKRGHPPLELGKSQLPSHAALNPTLLSTEGFLPGLE